MIHTPKYTYGVGRVDGNGPGAPNVLMVGSDERCHIVMMSS